MKPIPILALALIASADTAQAKIPLLNATCPGGIEVHADKGGPIYINGKEGKLHVYNDAYYEAKHGKVTISLMINPDHSVEVSYTGPGRANGICAVAGSGEGGCPPGVSEADRYKYPACN